LDWRNTVRYAAWLYVCMGFLMNANELADWIKNTEFYDNSDPNINDRMDKVEAMLRQQHAEIEALKSEIMDWISDSPYNIIPEDYFKAILKKAREHE